MQLTTHRLCETNPMCAGRPARNPSQLRRGEPHRYGPIPRGGRFYPHGRLWRRSAALRSTDGSAPLSLPRTFIQRRSESGGRRPHGRVWRRTQVSDSLSLGSGQHPGYSCQHSPRGRLRYVDRHRRHATATANAKLTFHLNHSARGPTNARLYS